MLMSGSEHKEVVTIFKARSEAFRELKDMFDSNVQNQMRVDLGGIDDIDFLGVVAKNNPRGVVDQRTEEEVNAHSLFEQDMKSLQEMAISPTGINDGETAGESLVAAMTSGITDGKGKGKEKVTNVEKVKETGIKIKTKKQRKQEKEGSEEGKE
eukprot:TRINITY_DN779_c0_g2_i2.p3 TRINITY_DN779_c0_g2~~TRINITY_DN779_c0_g2_i2.p3  ORF type:complete len:154 (+),score=60.80 TRINITY_DN779_c0_g2_i2:291-752(+)